MGDVPHILLIEARFYEDLADELIAGAEAAIASAGATYERASVPGVFEIPAAVRIAMECDRFDGYVALGAVIRGETTHYDYVCNESARGLNDLAITHGIALGYGILTTENRAQAWERAARSEGNKGAHAAGACLAMIALRRKLANGAS